MKTIRSKTGPFATRPHYKLTKIDEICAEELRSVGLYPSKPEPVRIERFIEKRFHISPRYEELPEGLLGFTKFDANGVKEVVISGELDGAKSGKPNERRLRTTLAHEAGHCLLHAHLFCDGIKPKSLFGEADESPEILCRDAPWKEPTVIRGYDGRWWEFQANKAIGGLLMPRRLVELALEGFTTEVGSLGYRTLAPENRERGFRALSAIFDVNPIVARIRLDDVFPQKNETQLLF
jgi:hypothetical protein